ncbi:hypothetical protein OIU76_015838 [Salix suchowensis]|uniref:non-specific serine/threonine protein kinase n=1 Tax=Salix suchowensis TaxID=1278906 RepID=A0ABQ9AW62_9ROSI|nr:hypothetical protein OIU77_004985 [Salix suchowensis]KAJ6379104.1 hypothetical protein OIU76_015838 [Salix suchowensis]
MPEIESVSENALFGKYEVGKLLGCGAFAKVYHARDVQTGKSVAIKIINKKKISNPSLMSNIKREISIMRKLNHPHIVKLIEVMASKTKIYFVMEYVKGGELFAKVAKGRFSEDLSRKYFHQLISAVGYCHSSAVTDQIRTDGLLHTLCGTPAYVAPEILAKKGYDGAKVDVWSSGVVLFVLTAGFLPFNDPNLMDMYKKIYKGEFRCPKWMSTDLKRFLSRLLDTNPETRITIDGILKDPWFKKGKHKEINFYDEDLYKGTDEKKDENSASTSLNAFDIISFSSGLNLSGLFDDSYNVVDDGKRFVSTESPENLMKKVEEFAKEERLRVKRRKEWGLEMEGQNGNLMISVEVYLLTDTLFVVEAKRTGGDAGCFTEIWKNKLKPVIMAA